VAIHSFLFLLPVTKLATMPTSISKGYFLRLLRQQPFLQTPTSDFFIVPPSDIAPLAIDCSALKELIADQAISFFEYIEESKVIVIETESRVASSRTATCLYKRRRPNPVGHIWPRTSVFCMESS